MFSWAASWDILSKYIVSEINFLQSTILFLLAMAISRWVLFGNYNTGSELAKIKKILVLIAM